MKYKTNWRETKGRFEDWWNGYNSGRPLMKVIARKKFADGAPEHIDEFTDAQDLHMNLDKNIKRYRNYLITHTFFAESFPNFDFNLGAGSMAVYLGAQPVFKNDTIWFRESVHDGFRKWGRLSYDPDNYWWKKHCDLIKRARILSEDDFLINMPDIVENIDILAAMRGPQELCYDLADEPEVIKDYIKQVDDLYFKYYDLLYNIVKADDGSSSYTAFDIWGKGKTAKVQCDFCSLMSPFQFRELVQPSLKKQCNMLDNSLFHLDGPDSIKHLDAVLEIEEIDAVQWTPGAGRPDCGNEIWYYLYDRIRSAGKSLWILLCDGDVKDWIRASEKLVKRYGTGGLYIIYPEMDENDALVLMEKAEKDWS